MSVGILFLLSYILIGIGAVPLSEFFPFGFTENDVLFERNDDKSTPALSLPGTFPYFDRNHHRIYLANNGLLSFLGPINEYVPTPFPLSDSRRVVAGFWSDIDTRGNISSGNQVFYQIYDRSTSNSVVFNKSKNYIQQYFPLEPMIRPKMVITATWYRVGSFSMQTDLLNTFQIVLVTDEIRSFAFLLYHELQWASPSSNRNSTSTGTTGGQAGFNAGDGIVFQMLPYSRTDHVHLLANTSNVNVPGLFVFRIDQDSVVIGGCGNSSQMSFRPKRASQLGLTTVTIQGPCFTNLTSEQVRCRFGDSIVVNATIIDDYQAICLTPLVPTPTRMHLFLSVDHGQTFELLPGLFTFTPAEYGVSIQETTTISIPNLSHMIVNAQQPMILQWFISTNTMNQWATRTIRLRIEICRATVNETIGGLMINTCRTLVYDHPPTAGIQSITVYVPSINEEDLKVIFFRIVASDTTTDEIYAGYHSTLLVLHDRRPIVAQFCHGWASKQPMPATWNENLYPCPRNIQQARVARCCYEPDLYCREDNRNSITNCQYRQGNPYRYEPNAVACYLSKSKNQFDAGTECCYDEDGDLVLYGNGAGTTDRYRPSSQPVLHFFNDILPHLACCVLNNDANGCKAYLHYRPPQAGADSPHPSVSTWGDPHFRTLDGTDYTFNGYGEYTYLAISDNSLPQNVSFDRERENLVFRAQIRITPLPSSNTSATVIRGFAARSYDPLAENISITISKRERVVVRRGHETLDLESSNDPDNYLNNNRSLIFFFPEMILERNRTTGVLTLSWSIGVSIQLIPTVVHTNLTNTTVFTIDLSISDVYLNRTFGLLGSYDHNPSNDLCARNGSIVDRADSLNMERIHRDFGQTWLIDPEYSLFFYEHDDSPSFYRTQSIIYTPIFSLPQLPEDQHNRTIHACHIDPTSTNRSEWTVAQRTCYFDIAITNDINFGQLSQQVVAKLDQISSDQRIPSPFNLELPSIMNVNCRTLVHLRFKSPTLETNRIVFSLVQGPPGAILDSETGYFKWYVVSPIQKDVIVIVSTNDTNSGIRSKHQIILRIIDAYRCVPLLSASMRINAGFWIPIIIILLSSLKH